jgi:hypothetical protein
MCLHLLLFFLYFIFLFRNVSTNVFFMKKNCSTGHIFDPVEYKMVDRFCLLAMFVTLKSLHHHSKILFFVSRFAHQSTSALSLAPI